MVTSSGGPDSHSYGGLTVLYDGDCGICQTTVRVLARLDRHDRLSLMPLQTAATNATPTLDELLDSLHAVDEQGRWWVGADAVVEIARRVAVLAPVSLVARSPYAMVVLDIGYRWIARNRRRLSRLLGMAACYVRRPVGSAGSSE